MERFAEFIIKRRLVILSFIIIVTIYFGYQMATKLKVNTIFSDLLPLTHPYIKIHNEFRQLFGGANFLVTMVKVREDNIFNVKTLSKVKYITEELEKIPGVDRYKILSIASHKMKDYRATAWGMVSTPLMYPELPKNEEAMDLLKDAIFSNEMYYGNYVSFDTKKTLIFADFFEEEMDYRVVYKELVRIREQTEDENTKVCMVGNPMHLGVVADMTRTMNYVMAGTLVVIPILLYLCYRSIWGMIVVPLAGVISLIWGLGFMALIGYNLDPLVFVMPFLIALMAFRHSHQLYNRYYEEYLKQRDSLAGCRVIIAQMFLPGLTSVVTDAFGIAIVAIVPIALLRGISMACAFSSIVTVIIGLILTPILLSYIPISSKFLRHMEKELLKDKERRGFANRFADWLGPWLIARRGRYTVIVVVLIILGFSYYWSERLIVGDAQVGSNLLWPDSRYNLDAGEINRNLPLINPLYIVLSGEKRSAIKEVQVLKDLEKFSFYMAKNTGGLGTQTVIGPIKGMGQQLRENDPKWYGFPDTRDEVETIFSMVTTSGDPGDMDKFIDYHDKFTNLVVFFKDKTGPTIKKAISAAKEHIETTADPGEGVQYKLAAGVIGVEAAINDVVAEKQLQTLLLALLGVFIFCTINFRSFKVGLVLMIPLAISNFMAFAYMALNQIGLSLSTLPVSAAGIGMGVDYGIYLVARLEEEKRRGPSISLETALKRTIQTYGKSVIYIAGTLVIGLLIWAFSGLKFQAQMGLMLAIILFLNCLGAVFLVPVLVLIFKPKFRTRMKEG
jgi:predicted RND superfamily exporter protein